jgi:uncharacterized membrane-anchored protein YhcB (DUF1043 family)
MEWHGLPVVVWAAIFSAVGAVIGAIIGSLLVTYLNYRFNWRLKQKDKEIADRARQADLYKSIYPEKFRTTKELMDKAAAVYSLTGQILITAPIQNVIDVDTKTDIQELAVLVYELRRMAESLAWLVSDNIKQQIDTFAHSCLGTIGISGLRATYEKAQADYFALCSTVKEELLLDDLDKLHRLSKSLPGTGLLNRNHQS